ncbi:hypothetical protein BASA84_001159 [Batrachochytrium salamandrivorans]|nr:hypothetical protein BASA62_007448 [Batrachochytrium salamandrivorans]KAH9254701.1 hypothetical protein BASA81_007252 [Batrachochytrium salamandrivorans]KAH9266348.1 hypothetical protein BASA84_001159 [Batrachochytrium salamandrivorans]
MDVGKASVHNYTESDSPDSLITGIDVVAVTAVDSKTPSVFLLASTTIDPNSIDTNTEMTTAGTTSTDTTTTEMTAVPTTTTGSTTAESTTTGFTAVGTADPLQITSINIIPAHPSSTAALAMHSSSPSSVESDRVERIAMLIRQHKELHLNKSTGLAAIPGRSFSSSTLLSTGTTHALLSHPTCSAVLNIDSVANVLAIHPSLTPTSSTHLNGSVATTMHDSGSDANMVFLKAASVDEGHDVVNSTMSHAQSSLLPATDDPQHSLPTDSQIDAMENKSPQHHSSLPIPIHPPGVEPDIHSNDSLPIPSSLTDTLKQYKERHPVDVGRLLYNGMLPGCRPNDISLIIGKGDDYHRVVLESYMNSYDFSEVGLDEAFRQLCTKLYLAGETQMVDRILYQFSRRYWDCNISLQPMFRSVDIVYGILFSIVLLNTDVHIVNVGSNQSKRMSRRTFIKNTMELVDSMVLDTEKTRQEEPMDIEAVKRWKKVLDTLLRDLYTSILNNRIIQNASSLIDTNDESAHLSVQQSQSPTSTTLARDQSNWSLLSGQSVGSACVSSEQDRTSISSTGYFRRRTGLQHDRSSLLGFLRAATETSTSIGSGVFEVGTNLSPDWVSMNMRTPERMPIPAQPAHAAGIVLEGLLIRKHITEKGDMRAKNRRWSKLWCSLRVHADCGVQLIMARLASPRESETFLPSELSGRSVVAMDDAIWALSTPALALSPSSPSPISSPISGVATSIHPPSSLSSFSSPTLQTEPLRHRSGTLPSASASPIEFQCEKTDTPDSLATTDRRHSLDVAMLTSSEPPIRLSPREPEVISLLHAYCSTLQVAYSSTRAHVLTLKLSDGSEYFFQAPTAALATEWARCINYWSACKSKEPMRGSMSSMEHGWTWIVWERKAWQAEGPTPVDEDMMGPLYFFQNLKLRSGSVDVPSRTSNVSVASSEACKSSSASIRSMTSNGSDGVGQGGGALASSSASFAGTISSGLSFGFLASRSAKLKSRPKPKISEWLAPSGFGHIISNLGESAQLVAMQRQVGLVKTDILEHLSFKEPMDKYFADSPGIHTKAIANWNRRLRYLELELQKYVTFVRALTDARGSRDKTTVLPGNVMAAMSESPLDETSTVVGPSQSTASGGSGGGGSSSSNDDTTFVALAMAISGSHGSMGAANRTLNAINEDDAMKSLV